MFEIVTSEVQIPPAAIRSLHCYHTTMAYYNQHQGLPLPLYRLLAIQSISERLHVFIPSGQRIVGLWNDIIVIDGIGANRV